MFCWNHLVHACCMHKCRWSTSMQHFTQHCNHIQMTEWMSGGLLPGALLPYDFHDRNSSNQHFIWSVAVDSILLTLFSLYLCASLWNISLSRERGVWRTAGHSRPAEREIKCTFFPNQYPTVWRGLLGLEIVFI